ncbi:hypothetical protein B1no1_29170 [Thermolongibacillus altinsuensis]|nr:hypothetical protein B1no1_29170 [Thermolongibacillus altinsuensis]
MRLLAGISRKAFRAQGALLPSSGKAVIGRAGLHKQQPPHRAGVVAGNA